MGSILDISRYNSPVRLVFIRSDSFVKASLMDMFRYMSSGTEREQWNVSQVWLGGRRMGEEWRVALARYRREWL